MTWFPKPTTEFMERKAMVQEAGEVGSVRVCISINMDLISDSLFSVLPHTFILIHNNTHTHSKMKARNCFTGLKSSPHMPISIYAQRGFPDGKE